MRSNTPFSAIDLLKYQDLVFFNPKTNLNKDFKTVYKDGNVSIGRTKDIERSSEKTARKNTEAIIGAMLGDEGKGRIVDNKLGKLHKKTKRVYAIRFQGGNNAGHTVEFGSIKVALHLVPSGTLQKNTIGIMDRGMVIHPDLQTEVAYVEKVAGDIKDKLLVSDEAILATDLERAEEVFNRLLAGNAKGGTGRGISPAYARRLSRTGTSIGDLKKQDWKEFFAIRYDQFRKLFKSQKLQLSQVIVPDFEKTKHTGIAKTRIVGSKKVFLERLGHFRSWIIKHKMITNTYLIHEKIYRNINYGVLFEGAQAVGLHPWLGTLPDVTSSDTSAYGLMSGTGFWRPQDIQKIIGVFKATYTSSVGARTMSTKVSLDSTIREPKDLSTNASSDQLWASYVRKEAGEYGTTTGRPRDILHLDLSMMRYNCRMSGIDSLAATHLDIAREDETIKVCTHYTDKQGTAIPYQPGFEYQARVTPYYIQLPGWDGRKTKSARSFEELPENAQKYLSFIQRRVGFPIAVATTGPNRDNYIDWDE